MDLAVTTSTVGGQAVVSVNGEVDVYTAPTLRDQLTGLLDSGTKSVIVDMSQVGFCDSTGLGSLVAALNHAREKGGTLALVAAQDRVLKLLRITGLDQVFTLYPSVDDAVGTSEPH